MESLLKEDKHSSIKNRIVYFYFNLTRKTNTEYLEELSKELDDMISTIIYEKNLCELEKNEKRRWYEYLCGLYKLVIQTRDMVYGKGERDLTYMMLVVWYKYFPVLSIYALNLMLHNISDSGVFTSYGSWSDIKYFCGYFMRDSVKLIDDNKKKELLNTVIELMNHQIDEDRRKWNSYMENYLSERSKNPMSLTTRPYGREIMSLACKWVPREKSKYGWLYEYFVVEWFRNDSPHLLTKDGKKILPKYETDCKRRYRKMVSILNKELDTVQVKQCKGEWNDIEPDCVPLVTLIKQRNAFCNNKNIENQDRKNCSETFEDYYKEDFQYRKKEKTVCQKQINISELIKIGLNVLKEKESEILYNKRTDSILDWVNSKWEELVNTFGKYEKDVSMIPIMDICWNLDDFTRNKMLGVAILLSQLSIGEFVISGQKPEVISAKKDEKLVDILKKVYYLLNHITDASLNRTYDFIYEGVMSIPCSKHIEVSNFTFVLLSDFNSEKDYTYLYDKLNNYSWCGVEPYFIYWNIGDNNINNVVDLHGKHKTIISGDSMGIFDYFFRYGIHGIKHISSYEYLGEILNHPRYKKVGEFANEFFTRM